MNRRLGERLGRSVLALLLAVLLTGSNLAQLSVWADAVAIPEEKRLVLTLGADLPEEQKEYILNYFGVLGQDINTIVVTNQDEREYLEGKIPDEQIGTHTLSCALIRVTDANGIQVKTANMNYVTSNTIASNLSTSGVYNCEVLTAAPFEVSGTGALTGVMMAYEAATGLELDPDKKDLANDELVLTGELAQEVGQDEAALVVNDIKIHIVRDQLVEEEEIRDAVDEVIETTEEAAHAAAQAAGFEAPPSLGEVHREKLYDFGRRYGSMDYSYKDLQRTLERVTHNITQSSGIKDPIEDTFETLNDDSSLDPDSILLRTSDEVLGDDANINATNSAALGDHEAEAIDVYAGDVTLTLSGGVKADGFVPGTNLVRYKDLNGSYALMDLNGNIVTEALYSDYFTSDKGCVCARLNDDTQKRGLLYPDGSTAVPFLYDDVIVTGDSWATGIILAEGTEEDYDYFGFSGGYYVIDKAEVYHLADGGSQMAGSLERENYADARGLGDYINIADRTGTITTYDAALNVLRIADSLYDFGEYDEDGKVSELIREKTGCYVGTFYGSYAKLTGDDDRRGLTDRYGNVILPVEFDDILEGDAGYEAYGYFGVSKDEKFAYVSQGGQITGSFDVPGSEVTNYGMSAKYLTPEGRTWILSGDGVLTDLGEGGEPEGLRASRGMFWTAESTSGKYNLYDWHGNELLTDCDSYSVSANGNYLIAQDGYTSSSLYLVNDASPVKISETAGGASEVEVQTEAAGSLELYDGTVVLNEAGKVTADGFVDGADLLVQRDGDGRALADLTGKRLTEPDYYSFWFRRGLLVSDNISGEKEGLVSPEGQELLKAEFDKVDVLSENWAVAYKLTPDGTEDDCDFIGSDNYYHISEAWVCYIGDDEFSYVQLQRDQFEEAYAVDDYINIKDRSTGLVTTFDAQFEPVGPASGMTTIDIAPSAVRMRKIKDTTGLFIYDSNLTDGYVRVEDNSRDEANMGVADSEGNLVLPCEYDRVLTYSAADGSHFWADGYFAVEKDGSAGYVSSGGNVSCEIKYSPDTFDSHGVAARIEKEDGTVTILAADGTESSGYTTAYALGGKGKFWRVRASEDADGYDVIDWHGNVLFAGVSDAEVSADDQYMLIWEDYGEEATLYTINNAVVKTADGEEQTEQQDGTQEEQPAEPQEEQPAEPQEEQPADTPEAQTEEQPENSGSIEDLLNEAVALTDGDFDGSQEQILSLLKEVREAAEQEGSEVSGIIGSAVTLMEGGAAGADTIAALLSSALDML